MEKFNINIKNNEINQNNQSYENYMDTRGNIEYLCKVFPENKSDNNTDNKSNSDKSNLPKSISRNKPITNKYTLSKQ